MDGYEGLVGAYHVYRNNRADAAVPTSISIVARNGRFSDILVEDNTVSEINLGPKPSDPLDFNGVLLRGNHAALSGKLSGNEARKSMGVLILPR
jgi:hypothetical protein